MGHSKLLGNRVKKRICQLKAYNKRQATNKRQQKSASIPTDTTLGTLATHSNRSTQMQSDAWGWKSGKCCMGWVRIGWDGMGKVPQGERYWWPFCSHRSRAAKTTKHALSSEPYFEFGSICFTCTQKNFKELPSNYMVIDKKKQELTDLGDHIITSKKVL